MNLPGTLSRTGWTLRENLSFEDWVACGKTPREIEGSVQWWLGDWWAYGNHAYGERVRALEDGLLGDLEFSTVHHYGTVARAIESGRRRPLVSFSHHTEVAKLPPKQQDRWLDEVEAEGLPVMKLRWAIRQRAAIDRTNQVEFDAKKLGKFSVIYANPPWRYENPPMGASNRAVENNYPTMSLDEICAMSIAEIANENSVLFLWRTPPLFLESAKVLDAWGYVCRSEMIWVKDKIGMGYHVRNQHEDLLICKRGELPPPSEEARRSSVVHSPRGRHSEKPEIFYDIIDSMYLGLRKIELFGRTDLSGRENWFARGNQASADPPPRQEKAAPVWEPGRGVSADAVAQMLLWGATNVPAR